MSGFGISPQELCHTGHTGKGNVIFETDRNALLHFVARHITHFVQIRQAAEPMAHRTLHCLISRGDISHQAFQTEVSEERHRRATHHTARLAAGQRPNGEKTLLALCDQKRLRPIVLQLGINQSEQWMKGAIGIP